MIRELTCVACPLGCPLTVTIENNEVTSVKGNTCPRGAEYAKTECTHPVRSLTSTVKVTGGKAYVVPVKSSIAVPKEKLFDIMKEINSTAVSAPAHIGDVVIKDVLGTGADIVVTNEAV